MDILELIKRDHDKTLKALEDLEKTTERATTTRDKTWSTAKRDLLAHMYAEEEVFYPELQDDLEDKILEAIEEHNLVRTAMKILDDTPMDDKRWAAKLKVIKENVEHHIEEEEEGGVFEAARKNFGKDELQDMGKSFQDAKEENLSKK